MPGAPTGPGTAGAGSWASAYTPSPAVAALARTCLMIPAPATSIARTARSRVSVAAFDASRAACAAVNAARAASVFVPKSVTAAVVVPMAVAFVVNGAMWFS